jgi:hypothetical protein
MPVAPLAPVAHPISRTTTHTENSHRKMTSEQDIHNILEQLTTELHQLENETENLREMEIKITQKELECLKKLADLDSRAKRVETQVIQANADGKPQRRKSILNLLSSRETPSMLLSLQRRLTLLKSSLPRNPPLLLRLALGTPTPTIIRPHTARLAYKQSYEAFKVQASVIQGVCALINVLFFDNKVVDGVFLLLTLFYYSNMTIRELVLRVNGSRVRSWWIMHHVLTVILIGVVLVCIPFFTRLTSRFGQAQIPIIDSEHHTLVTQLT